MNATFQTQVYNLGLNTRLFPKAIFPLRTQEVLKLAFLIAWGWEGEEEFMG
jgi:hypothetical protein